MPTTIDKLVLAQARLRSVRADLVRIAAECEGRDDASLQLMAAAGDLFTEAEKVTKAADEIINTIRINTPPTKAA